LREAGVLTERVGIGGLKPLKHFEARDIIVEVRRALSSSHSIHVFGASSKLLRYPRVIESADSMDSQVYEFRRQRRENVHDWKTTLIHYLRFRQEVEDALEKKENPRIEAQQSLGTF